MGDDCLCRRLPFAVIEASSLLVQPWPEDKLRDRVLVPCHFRRDGFGSGRRSRRECRSENREEMGQGQPKPCSAQQMLALGLRLHQTKRGGLADGAGPEGCEALAVGGPHGFSGFASPERERKPAPLASDTSLRQCTAVRALLATLTFALPLAFGWVRIDSGVASADARNDSHRNQKRYRTRTSQGLGHGRSRQGAAVRQMRLGSGAFAALTCLAVWVLVDLAKIRSARGLGYCAQLRQKDGQTAGQGSNPEPLFGTWDTTNLAHGVFLSTAQENCKRPA